VSRHWLASSVDVLDHAFQSGATLSKLRDLSTKAAVPLASLAHELGVGVGGLFVHLDGLALDTDFDQAVALIGALDGGLIAGRLFLAVEELRSGIPLDGSFSFFGSHDSLLSADALVVVG